MTIQTLDLNFRNESDGVPDHDYWRMGDHNDFCSGACPGPSTRVNVYRPDPTPSTSPTTCSGAPRSTTHSPRLAPTPPFDPAQWNYWDTLCGGAIDTSSSPDGIWIIQIVANDGNDGHTDGSANQQVSGLNRYSIRSTTANIFALGDFSIYNNASGTATRFYLAEVPDHYAGKTFVVEMYDTGESAATGTLQPIDPSPGNAFNPGACRIYSRTINQSPWGSPDTVISAANTCQELVNPGEYNGLWPKFEMDLPIGFSCVDCWWKMNCDYATAVNDTTTWRAFMVGNPIHLIPRPSEPQAFFFSPRISIDALAPLRALSPASRFFLNAP
jgi:hypothetical protein